MKMMEKHLVLTLVVLFVVQVFFANVAFAGPYYPDLQVKNAYTGNVIYPMKVINDFNTPDQVALWREGVNTQEINYVTSILNGPGQPFEGAGCLEQVPEKVKVYEWRTIYRDFDIPLDLSNANFIALAANCYGWLGEGFYLKLVLYSGTDSYETIGRCTSDKWSVIYYDISQWDKRNAITKMEISFVNNFDLEGVVEGQPGYEFWDGRFQIDYICATQVADMSFEINGNTEGFKAEGGMVKSENGSLKYEITSDNSFVESGFLGIEAAKRNVINVSMVNVSGAKLLKISWITNNDPIWDDTKSKLFDISDSNTLTEYNFPLGDKEAWTGNISKIRIAPVSAVPGGYMEIDNIKLGYKEVKINSYKGKISTCLVTDDKTHIRVSGNILSQYVSERPEAKLQIFELTPYEDEQTYIYSDEKALGQQDITDTFSFELPLMRDADHSRIYSKFVVVSKEGNGTYVLIDCGHYITNPEIVAVNDYPFPQTQSIKGLQVQLISDAEELGVQHAAINIPYNTMLYRNGNHPSDTLVYHFEGEDFYFKKGTVEYIDNVVKSLTDNNIVVTAILIMYKTDINDDTPNEFLIHPDATDDGTVYAFNTANEIGMKYYKAITNFLAERYSREDKKYGRIMNYIVGNEIGQNKIWNNMGPKLLPDYIEDYERTLRLTNTIVKSHNKEARVYISLDHFWNAGNPPDSLWTYDNKLIVDTLNEYVKEHGDFGWNIAFHPYPENLFDPEFWKDESATESFDTIRITFKNIDILVKYLQREQLLYNGQSRRIILSEQGFHSNNTPEGQLLQAAAYAYAYYKVKFLPGIDAFILHRHVDHSQEGGLNLGLWTNESGSICSPDMQKYIYDVFKYIDTERSLEVTEFAKDIIGIDNWESAIPGFNADKLEKRPIPVKDTAGVISTLELRDRMVISDFENGTDDWRPAENMYSVVLDSSEKLSGSYSLKGSIMAGYKKDYKGIVKDFAQPLDLTSKPYLYAVVKLTGMPTAVQEGVIMLRAYSGDQVCEGTAKVQPDAWNIVGLDLSKWKYRNSIDKIKIWALPAGAVHWTSGALYLDEIGAVEQASLKNIDIALVKPDKISAGDTITLTITNNGNEVIEDTVLMEGLNGIEINKMQETIQLAPGQSISIPIFVTAANIEPMTRGQLKVTVDGKDYVYDLSEVFIPEVVYEGNTAILGDFEKGSLDHWMTGDATESINSVMFDTKSGQAAFPSKASHGDYMLEAVKKPVIATTPSRVLKELSEPLDLTAYDKIDFEVFGWGGTSTKYIVNLTLTAASGERYTYEEEILPNRWTTISADIGGWNDRNQLKKIEISYRGKDTAYFSGGWSGCFYIDYVRTEKEQTPPKTSLTLSGTNQNGWYRSEVTVELTAQDNLSGVEKTEYRIGNGEWTAYTEPIIIKEDGIFTLQYRSTDRAGNVEETQEAVIQIDKVAPDYTLEANGVILTDGASFEDCYQLLFKVTDNLSGIACAQITIGETSYTLEPPTQSSIKLDLSGKPGSHTAVVVIEDNAGNRREESFSFTVTTSIASMNQLIEGYIQSGDLSGPLVEQLSNNLKQAQHQLDIKRPGQAAKHMEDFIKHLNNEALAEHIKSAAKETLNADAKALVKMWRE